MKYLIFLILALSMYCQDKQVKEIEVKYNDRSETIEQVEKRVEKIPNNPDTIKLKEEIAILTKELRTLNGENKACQMLTNSQAVEIAENRKQLKKAEWSMGFVGAFKWTGIILGILLALLGLWKFAKPKII